MKNSWKGHKDKKRHKNKIKGIEQTRWVYVKDVNRNIPHVQLSAQGPADTEIENPKLQTFFFLKRWSRSKYSFACMLRLQPEVLPLKFLASWFFHLHLFTILFQQKVKRVVISESDELCFALIWFSPLTGHSWSSDYVTNVVWFVVPSLLIGWSVGWRQVRNSR